MIERKPAVSGSPKRALVTGASRGIGAEIARQLAREGFGVVALGRSEVDLHRVVREIEAAGGRATALAADLGSAGGVEAAVTDVLATGPIAVLVNNAGLAESAPLRKTTDAFWERHVALNMTAPFALCRALVPPMAERGFGRVINIASTAAKIGFPYTAAYSASKAGLVGLTRALAAEFAQKGVTVNAVCPGWVETELGERAIANIVEKTQLSPEAARARLAEASPQKRFLRPEEIAAVVAYLAGESAGGVNGQAWNVDGGQVMG